MKKSLLIILICSIIFVLSSCGKETAVGTNRAVIGIAADIESLNPLFARSVDEGVLSELLYLGLFLHEWDGAAGELGIKPMIAKQWEWNEDTTSLTVYLRDDIFWRDGKQLTAEDVIFSFDLYSDPEVNSRLFGSFENFYLNNDLSIDSEKIFKVDDPFTITINFKANSAPTLFDVSFPILPKHAFEKIDRENFMTLEKGLDTITSGPFYLEKWEKNSFITLKANVSSFLNNPENIDELIFKIVPSYNSRLTQLKSGEIDFMEDLNPADAVDIEKNNMLNIEPVKGRFYDYLGWNNIDPEQYEKNNQFVPHRIFGDQQLRIVLTHAINREEIVDNFLENYGSVAVSPVAPIFKKSFDDSIQQYEYDPEKAKKLLTDLGWIDKDKDGIREKNGAKLTFAISIPSGNPRREFAATVIKNNFLSVGVDANIQYLEPGVLFDKLFAHQLDAWMVGWNVEIPIELKFYWHSNMEENSFNVAAYRSKKADRILEELQNERSQKKRNELMKEFQKIIHEENPVTFLYWVDNITAYNKRLKNIIVNPLGGIQQPWNWRTTE